MTVDRGTNRTLTLPAGFVLTVVSTGTGYVNRLADSAGGVAQSVNAIAAGETQNYGPYSVVAQFDVVCASGSLAATTAPATPLTSADTAALSGTTATAAEINAEADLSINLAVIKCKVILISTTPTGAEQDTAFDLPAKAVLIDAFIDVTTAEATGGTKTIDVGLLSSESGGDADGFLDGLSVAAAGIKRGEATVAAGVFSANTRGVLLSDFAAGTNADDRGLYRAKPHLSTAVTARSITFTAGSNDFAEFRGSLILFYVEIA